MIGIWSIDVKGIVKKFVEIANSLKKKHPQRGSNPRPMD